MLPEFKVDRFVDQFVIGSLVFLGAWYLHRPFLQTYFPNLAADPAARAAAPFEADIAIVLFVVSSVVIGVLLTHTADVAIVASFVGNQTGRLDRSHRRLLRFVARPFTVSPAIDPRVNVIERYGHSPRREMFLAMLDEWAMTDEETIKDAGEAVLAHQHLVAHMRARNDRTRAAVDEAYAPVMFAAALFLAFCALVVIALLAFWTAFLVSDVRKVQPTGVLAATALGLWWAAVMTGYSLRRRFRDFCNGIVTTALHFYIVETNRESGVGTENSFRDRRTP